MFLIEGSVLLNIIWMKLGYDPKFLLLMSEMSVDHKHSAPSLGVGLLGQPNDGWNFGISHLNTSRRYDGRLCLSRFVTRFYYHQTTQNLCYCVNIFVVYINQSRSNLFIGFTQEQQKLKLVNDKSDDLYSVIHIIWPSWEKQSHSKSASFTLV